MNQLLFVNLLLKFWIETYVQAEKEEVQRI